MCTQMHLHMLLHLVLPDTPSSPSGGGSMGACPARRVGRASLSPPWVSGLPACCVPCARGYRHWAGQFSTQRFNVAFGASRSLVTPEHVHASRHLPVLDSTYGPGSCASAARAGDLAQCRWASACSARLPSEGFSPHPVDAWTQCAPQPRYSAHAGTYSYKPEGAQAAAWLRLRDRKAPRAASSCKTQRPTH